MATFTITTAVNIDSLAAKAGADIYNINGGYLTVDQHSRYGTNQNTSAALGNITLSATLGGTIEFNSTLVRLIPYDTGTGNVPALDTVISQGSASGKLLGVYSALNVAPTAAAAAMPASGFILVRQWNSVAYSAGALTGISASATAADRAGWLEIVGVDAGAVTVNRLNLFKVRGDYFDFLGVTTDGNRATTYQLPSNGSIVYCPGVEVETGTGTGVYEFYPCAGSKSAGAGNIATDAVRGRWCWISTAGLVRFGHDGTNSASGFIPPAGRKIRVPNIFFVCCTAAAPTVNALPSATLLNRYEVGTAGGGVVDVNCASVNWYLNMVQPFSVALTNTFALTAMTLIECASPIAWSNVGVGQEAANTQTALTMSLNFAGGTMTNCVWTRASLPASGYITSWTDSDGFAITGERNHSLTKAANAVAGSMALTRVSNSTWDATVLGGGRVFKTTCADLTFTDTTYYDHPATTTGASLPMYVFDISAGTRRCTYDGLDFGGLDLVQPYSGVLNIGAAGCSGITLRNLGTAAAPLEGGGAYVDATWTRATNAMTVTRAAHGLKVSDLLAVIISSDVTPKAVTPTAGTVWSIVTVPTADTFTVSCLNAGATSGTLSYYQAVTETLVNVATGAAASDIKVQRCYVPHLRGRLLNADNSSRGVTYENVWGGDWSSHVGSGALNLVARGIQASPSLAGGTSFYGTHWIDAYTTGAPANIASQAWTRSTTTATVTNTNHGMRTGDQIVVEVTSDATAITLGVKSITVPTRDTFSFTCLNAGGASGTLTFAPMNGRVAVLMNEATAESASQASVSNGAAFTSAGGLYMPTVNHQADFTASANIRGHSKFPIAEAVMAGGTITNYDITYSLNGGTTYKNLSYPRAGGGGASASNNVTMTSTTGVAAGDYVFGTGIAPNAKVSSITDGTTVVVDIANTGTVSGILRFNQLPSETVADPAVGFPLKVRIVTSTTNTTAISSLYFFTSSTDAARAAQYPLDAIELTITGLVSGSDIVILNAGTETERVNVDANAGTSYVYSFSTGGNVDICVYKAGYVPFAIRNYALPTSASTVPVAQLADRNYTP